MNRLSARHSAARREAGAKQYESYFPNLNLDLNLFRMETQETVVYNTAGGESFVLPVECPSSGGLAQLGEHYVRNVGVGGSTPLPSTKASLIVDS